MNEVHEQQDGAGSMDASTNHQENMGELKHHPISQQPHTAGYGYHRRRLRLNQDSRSSIGGPSGHLNIANNAGKNNLVSSSVHQNLLLLVLTSFMPLLMLQGITDQ